MKRFFLFLSVIFLTAILPASAQASKSGLFPEELISMDALHQKIVKKEKLVLFDARGKQSYEAAHLPGALLPLSAGYYRAEELFRSGVVKSLPDRDRDLAAAMQKYPKETPIVTYCNDNCQAAAVLLLQIKKLGFQNVRALDGGIQSWQAAGFPVVTADHPA